MASQWGLRGCCWRVMGGGLLLLLQVALGWIMAACAGHAYACLAILDTQPFFLVNLLFGDIHNCQQPVGTSTAVAIAVASPNTRDHHSSPSPDPPAVAIAFPIPRNRPQSARSAVHPQQALPPQPQSQVSNPCGGASCMPFADSGPCCRDWLVDHTSLQTPNSDSNPNNARLRRTATKFILLPADLGLTTRRQPPSILT